MPLYEYACEACGTRFERIQKFSDPLVDVCPTCGKGPVTKLISAPGFQFKGSGWYVTDYARKTESGGSGSSKDSNDSKESKESKESPASAESKDKSTSSSTESSKEKPASAPESTAKK